MPTTRLKYLKTKSLKQRLSDFHIINSQDNHNFSDDLHLDSNRKKSTYDYALDVSKNTIKSTASESGLIAGSHHFKDIWARDAFFASLGSTYYYPGFTKQTIEAFFKYQKINGEIPYRIFRTANTPFKYIGKSKQLKNLRPNYKNPASLGGFVPDGGLLLIIAFDNYIKATSDLKLLDKYYQKLVKTIDFYITQTDINSNLIHEKPLSGWMDSILKSGMVFYTNLLYFAALKSIVHMSDIYSAEIKKTDYSRHKKQLQIVKEELINKFYNGTYFVDYINPFPEKYFTTYSNLLAIWFDLATKKQSESILTYISNKVEEPNVKLLRSVYPRYPRSKVFLMNHVIRMSEYHNEKIRWLQPTIMYALTLKKLHYKDKSKVMLRNIAELIANNRNVYEIFDVSGQPIFNHLYKSERNFSWAAGLYMLGYLEIINPNQKLSLSSNFLNRDF